MREKLKYYQIFVERDLEELNEYKIDRKIIDENTLFIDIFRNTKGKIRLEEIRHKIFRNFYNYISNGNYNNLNYVINLNENTDYFQNSILTVIENELFTINLIDKLYNDEEILRMHLKNIYINDEICGVEEASLYYFEKELEELNLPETIILSTLLQGADLEKNEDYLNIINQNQKLKKYIFDYNNF